MDTMASDWMNAAPSMGTTNMAVQHKDSIVLGADSRTTTGVYVASRASDKTTERSDNLYLCKSGSAADTQVVSDYVRYFLKQLTYEGPAVYGIPLGGTLLRLPFATGGSGSCYLYGFLDHAWRENLSEAEAEAVSLAMARDGGSGGVDRTVTVKEKGVKPSFHSGDKLPLWHQEIPPILRNDEVDAMHS